jgi:DNA-binding NarL/FixJ family response regulator
VVSARRKTAFKVCLISSHALFLNHFQNVILSAGFCLQLQQLGNCSGGDVNEYCVSPASVYVADAHSAPQLTNTLVTRILEQHPNAQLIVLADKFDERTAFPLLQLGVKGLLNYTEAAAHLIHAIEAVSSGRHWVPRVLLSQFVDKMLRQGRAGRTFSNLSLKVSRREEEILAGLLENLSNKEIANQLNISERTVKFHVSNLLAKYGVQRRADLILLTFQIRTAATVQ